MRLGYSIVSIPIPGQPSHNSHRELGYVQHMFAYFKDKKIPFLISCLKIQIWRCGAIVIFWMTGRANYHQSLTLFMLRNCLQDLKQRIVCNRIPSHWSLRPHVKEGREQKQGHRPVTLVDVGKLMDSFVYFVGQKWLSSFIWITMSRTNSTWHLSFHSFWNQTVPKASLRKISKSWRIHS